MRGIGGETHIGEQFSVSVAEASAAQLAQMEHAVDIRVENFDISAGGKLLFDKATLSIAQGRRYGLVGPNGWVHTVLNFSITAKNNASFIICAEWVRQHC